MSLSFEEHEELGSELKNCSGRLRQLCGLVVSEYGPQSLAGFNFLKAMEMLDRLQQEMEAQASQDLQGYASKKLYL